MLTPYTFRLDGVLVTIWEVLKSKLIDGTVLYHVTVSLGVSKRFNLTVRSWGELRRKLLVEVSKYKLLRMLGKDEVVR